MPSHRAVQPLPKTIMMAFLGASTPAIPSITTGECWEKKKKRLKEEEEVVTNAKDVLIEHSLLGSGRPRAGPRAPATCLSRILR